MGRRGHADQVKTRGRRRWMASRGRVVGGVRASGARELERVHAICVVSRGWKAYVCQLYYTCETHEFRPRVLSLDLDVRDLAHDSVFDPRPPLAFRPPAPGRPSLSTPLPTPVFGAAQHDTRATSTTEKFSRVCHTRRPSPSTRTPAREEVQHSQSLPRDGQAERKNTQTDTHLRKDAHCGLLDGISLSFSVQTRQPRGNFEGFLPAHFIIRERCHQGGCNLVFFAAYGVCVRNNTRLVARRLRGRASRRRPGSPSRSFRPACSRPRRS